MVGALSNLGKGWGWVHLGPRDQDGEWSPLTSRKLRRDGEPPHPDFEFMVNPTVAREPLAAHSVPGQLASPGAAGRKEGGTLVSGSVETLDSNEGRGREKKGKKRGREAEAGEGGATPNHLPEQLST